MDLSLNYPSQVYIHDPKDVAFIKLNAPIIGFGSSLNVSFSTREILVDQSAWDLSVNQRGCILPGERVPLNFPKYSESACKAECLIKNQIEVCGCCHHLLPKTGNSKTCDLKGLHCLDSNFSSMKNVNKKSSYKTIRKCKCPPACDETEVKIIWGKKTRNSNKSAIQVHLQLTAPPTERLILKAKVNFLDSLVGFACFTRLFSSSSILGVVRSTLDWMFPYRPRLSYRQLLY
ncbi:pickpocket protein 11-like [Homalodisca vitripennis]|uniref:pickpocket protein 11-like n=1 Tax=Homalodisca vitripennis TaxID=197043 RepID=UPI001EECC606|nr:pickpocket protein 11-like [Homalodisca vitripennis]